MEVIEYVYLVYTNIFDDVMVLMRPLALDKDIFVVVVMAVVQGRK